MKICLLIILGMFTLCGFAQDREEIKGRVYQNKRSLENVFLRNVTTGNTTVTDVQGNFNLKVFPGDTLLFTHLGSADLIRILNKDDVDKDLLEVEMKEIVNELQEVNIENTPEINAVSLGIIKKEIKPLTQYERRLQTAGDFKWIHLLGILGGNLQIDPILNAINGRTKQLKQNVLVERKLKNIAILEGYHSYLQEELGLTETEAQRIISLSVEEENAQQAINTKNPERIKFFLLEMSIKFKSVE